MKVKLFEIKKMFWWEVVFLLLILAAAVQVRLPYLAEPFECDQANYSYIANHWQEGLTPYRYAWDNKPPLIFIWYRVISFFLGFSVRGIHLGFIFLALGSTLFFYALSRRLFSRGFALISAFLYAIFSAGALISGTFAITENLAVFFVIGGFYFFWNGCEREKDNSFFIAGIFLGLAMMSKQVAFWETAALTMFFVLRGLRTTTFLLIAWRLILFWSGAAVVIAFFILIFTAMGAVFDFFSSVLIYNLFFGKIVGIRQGLINLWQALFWTPRENFLLWFFAIPGLILAFSKKEKKSLVIVLWFFAALLGVVSALRFYPHYFIQVIPILVMFSVYFLQTMWDSLGVIKKFLSLVFFVIAVICFSAVQWRWWFSYSPLESLIARRGTFARPDLYRASEGVSAYIRARTTGEDFIYIWGLWPEIYYLSHRKSPSKYFYISSRGTMVGRFKEVVQTQVYYDIIKKPPKYLIIDEHFADLVGAPMQRYINSGYALVKKETGYRILVRKDAVD